MTRIFLLFIATLALISACGSDNQATTDEAPINEAPANEAREIGTSAPSDATSVVEGSAQPGGVAETTPEPSAPLNLEEMREQIVQLDEGLSEASVPEADSDDILPDLFDGDPQKKKTTLKGKVLTREEAESVEVSVDGIELELEVMLD